MYANYAGLARNRALDTENYAIATNARTANGVTVVIGWKASTIITPHARFAWSTVGTTKDRATQRFMRAL